MNSIEHAKRIAIIGNAGSGKSVLARKLHDIFGLPLYHLDQYFWKPNWTHPDLQEYKVTHDRLCEREAWIMDGMNLRLLEYRIQKADVIIFLDIPRYLCFWRIFKRVFTYYGKETPSSAAGCPEKLNWKFIKFLKWVWDFKKRYPGRIMELLGQYKSTKHIYILKSQKEIDELVKELTVRL